MDPDHRLGMVQRKDRRHPGPKVITARTIAGIPKLRHEPVPALRDVPVVDADLEWTRRETIPRQGGYDHVEVLEHQRHVPPGFPRQRARPGYGNALRPFDPSTAYRNQPQTAARTQSLRLVRIGADVFVNRQPYLTGADNILSFSTTSDEPKGLGAGGSLGLIAVC